MSVFAHYPLPAGVDRPAFPLVEPRFVAMPALLWAIAMAAALVVTAVQERPPQLARPAPAIDSSTHGA